MRLAPLLIVTGALDRIGHIVRETKKDLQRFL
jgi:hypothetical protein